MLSIERAGFRVSPPPPFLSGSSRKSGPRIVRRAVGSPISRGRKLPGQAITVWGLGFRVQGIQHSLHRDKHRDKQEEGWLEGFRRLKAKLYPRFGSGLQRRKCSWAQQQRPHNTTNTRALHSLSFLSDVLPFVAALLARSQSLHRLYRSCLVLYVPSVRHRTFSKRLQFILRSFKRR